jgi:phosphohistidine phosphatase
VVCSTALRARQTWELAVAGLRVPAPDAAPEVRLEPRVYEATVLGLLMLVREFDPDWQTVLLIGHNPGLAELTAGLMERPPEPPATFPTAAIAVLGLRGTWAEAGPEQARLLSFSLPGNMGA